MMNAASRASEMKVSPGFPTEYPIVERAGINSKGQVGGISGRIRSLLMAGVEIRCYRAEASSVEQIDPASCNHLGCRSSLLDTCAFDRLDDLLTLNDLNGNMSSLRLEASHIGPIEHADIRFGDLTVFVGPQATGKSILLQLLNLIVDTRLVLEDMDRAGLSWDGKFSRFLDAYLGEGMGQLWNNESSLRYQDKKINVESLIDPAANALRNKSLFYIPAQRVLTLGRAGWPRAFSDYSPGDPVVVRAFSEAIRYLVEANPYGSRGVFPYETTSDDRFTEAMVKEIFPGFRLNVDRSGLQRRLVLTAESGHMEGLPMMAWSSGQREFAPLLLGLSIILTRFSFPHQLDLEWVVIEEPEMGLHPRAISAVLLMILDLLSRNHRVCLSTHSPHVLDIIWAMRIVQEHGAPPEQLLRCFDIEDPDDSLKSAAQRALGKEAQVYYFDPVTHRAKDISTLDPGSEDISMSGWGGLTEFSGRISDVVAEVVSNAGRSNGS